MTQQAASTFPKETTFSSYNKEQGKAYAEVRRDYNPKVYQTILDHHSSTGGQFDTLLDVGCGPGPAARNLAPHFAHAIGIDPSDGMISTARSLGHVTSTEPVRFEVSTAEELGQHLSPPIQESSIDLITAATAAHWFDMSRFWPSAARVLKPGGSVTIWASSEIRAHPEIPNAVAIQAAIDRHNEEKLMPYFEPGNLLVRGRYADLPLPWNLAQPVAEFDRSTFLRKDWDVDEQFYVGEPEVNLDMLEKILATGSPVTRWRQAHPEAVGTERDVVKMLRKEIERLLHEAGVEPGKEKVKGAMKGMLLMVKRKA